jgi:hypothetical protein
MKFGVDPIVAMDSRWWPAIADALIASGAPWPEDAILADLRWWQDQERMGRTVRPGRPTLEKRWRVGGTVAKRLLKSEALWGLETKATSDRPADDQPTASAPQVAPDESEQNDQPATSPRPATVPTRDGTEGQKTEEQKEQQIALVPDATPVKRKGKPPPAAPDPEAVARCLDLWTSVSGRREGLTPGKGLHKAVSDAMAIGIQVERRLAYLASLNGTGTAGWARDNGVKLSAFLRAKSRLTDPLDAEADEWDANGRPVGLSPLPARAGPKRAATFWDAFDQEQGSGEVFDGQ